MEQQTWTLLRELSAKIPSVRIPVASLSGGQRQTVAIARSLIGDPRIVILDEPTAALGVAQTAEVLNLIERLRERGHGVVLVSHSMADVMAVADRVVVLRLGRNNGVYNIADVTSETLIAAITGAVDNAVTRRASDRATPEPSDAKIIKMRDLNAPPRRSERRRDDMTAGKDLAPPPLMQEPEDRLFSAEGMRSALAALLARIRGGDLGSLPVIVGLVVIWAVFQALNPVFLSSTNLVNLTMQCAAIGTIALGIVLVLLVGEIDLSVGSVSGLAAAILAVSFVQLQWNLVLALIAAIAAGALVGLLYGFLYTRFGLPSFVITLAGLLGFLGLQLWILGDTGSIGLPFDSWIVEFAQQWYLPAWASYVVAALTAAAYAWILLRRARQRAAANLVSQSYLEIGIRSGALVAFLLVAAWYLNLSRGVGVMFLFFLVLVVIVNFALTRTRWGRAVYAVGGSVDASRRAGIRVDRIYISVFMLCSTLAAVGGVLAAARLASANQSSGTGDVNLNAIAAAVIGGASLFGGRGTAFAALLGIFVIQSISSGLTLLNLDSSVIFMITGVVLVLAVTVDSLSRRKRAAAGRA